MLRSLASQVGRFPAPLRHAHQGALGACFALLAVTTESPLSAEPLRIHLRAGPAVAVSAPQSTEFSWGASATGAVEFPFAAQIGIAAELNVVWLADGSSPKDVTLADPADGAAFGGGVALHLRPFATNDPAEVTALSGLWFSASFGVAATGGDARLFSEAVFGWDTPLADGDIGLGPYAGLYHVFQPDHRLRPQDANILVFGLHAMLDTAPQAPRDFDEDGILDASDRCPTRAEDVDGYLDTDGCPDEDNDSDGVLDAVDQCPNQAEDKDRFEDENGCPDLDNDGDGLLDVSDQCPNQAEDLDGYEDDDGCPDLDHDQDGITDALDACPNEPETKNGYADHDGCPDAELVRVVGDKILLDDRVHFRTNSWIIRRKSFQLLNSVKQLIASHPEYVHISVHGHADLRGDDKFNQYLSERRAKSVMEHLITEGGLSASRLSYKGFGSTQPLAEGRDDAALYLNRRVEFKITREVETVVRAGPSPQQSAKRSEATAAGNAAKQSSPSTASQGSSAATAQPPAEDLNGSGPKIDRLFPGVPHLDDTPAELPVLPEEQK